MTMKEDMMHGMKLYVDTSVISALFDNRNPDRKKETEEFMAMSGEYDLYVSAVTTMELEDTQQSELRGRMLSVAKEFPELPVTGEVETLAAHYIEAGAVPNTEPEDALHIACAVVYGMDYLLSWNFRHLVKLRTKDTVNMVNTRNGYRHIEIITPAEIT